MRDAFYTILIIWIVWRVLTGINSVRTRQSNNMNNPNQKKQKEGETSVDYVPPVKKKISDDEGEYVDYEEIK